MNKAYKCVGIFLMIGLFATAAASQETEESHRERTQISKITADTLVYYNKRSGKYHIHSCSAAKSCTHCVDMPIREVRKLKGVPCGLCGGGGVL